MNVMDIDDLDLNQETLEDLRIFGTWYLNVDKEGTDIINALFRHGFCFVHISLCVAKTAMLNGLLGKNEAPWTPEIGYDSKVITAILKTLGLPEETRFCLELHSLSCAPWFCEHAFIHDKTSSIIPPPECAIGSDVYHQCCFHNQCTMARNTRYIFQSLQLKIEQRYERVLVARQEAIEKQRMQQQLQQLQNKNKKSNKKKTKNEYNTKESNLNNQNIIINQNFLHIIIIIFAFFIFT